jgi:hypothetical protein
MNRITRTRFPLLFLLMILTPACSDGGTNGPPTAPQQPGPPASIAAGASGQSAAAGAAVPAPLVVTVTDAQGRGVPNVSVSWSTQDGSITPSSNSTNATGQAQATWTLAPRLGTQTASAAAGTLSAAFSATGTAPATTTIMRLAGDTQRDSVAATLRDTLTVEVRLPTGQGLADAPLTWSVATGGGTITPLTAQTDASGRARAVWSLGTAPGEQRVTVSSPGLQPATFTATASPASPHSIVITPDSVLLDAWGDTARFNASARDRFDNLVATPVTWSSADTMVARVSGGAVTSHRAGRTTVSATAGTVSVSRPVNVPLQRNAQCRVPSAPVRGAALGAPSFSDVVFVNTVPTSAWPGSRSFPLDLDGDGDEDIIRIEYSFPGSKPYSGETRIFRNDNGVLRDATAELLAAPVIPDHARDFEIADFTGNGRLDVYVAQHGFDAEPFPGAPNLFFTVEGGRVVNRAPTAFAPSSSSGFTHGSSAADVDCDGDLDIMELNLLWTTPNTLFLNNGSGSFTPAPTSAFPFGGLDQVTMQRWQEVAFIDIDSDGDPDMVLGARSGTGWNEAIVLVNDGFGRFRHSPSIRLPAPRFAPNHAINNMKAADFDGDGLQDLILFEIPQPFSTSSAIRVWFNRGDGSFEDRSVAWGLPSMCSGELVEPLILTDINRDGWPDVIVPPGCAELRSGILINRGNRFEHFAFTRIAPWLDDYAVPIDIDRDGYPDLLFSDRQADVLLVRNLR